MDGFAFAGTHSGALGVWYRPDAKDRGSGAPDYDVEDLISESRDGGHYIGALVKPRAFE